MKAEMSERRPVATYRIDGEVLRFKDAAERIVESSPGINRGDLVRRMQALSDAPDDQVRNAVYYGCAYVADVWVDPDGGVWPKRLRPLLREPTP